MEVVVLCSPFTVASANEKIRHGLPQAQLIIIVLLLLASNNREVLC
jgi:hypothetical protein